MLALLFNVRGLGGGPLACLRSYRAVAAGTTFNAVSEPERGEDVEDVVKLNSKCIAYFRRYRLQYCTYEVCMASLRVFAPDVGVAMKQNLLDCKVAFGWKTAT